MYRFGVLKTVSLDTCGGGGGVEGGKVLGSFLFTSFTPMIIILWLLCLWTFNNSIKIVLIRQRYTVAKETATVAKWIIKCWYVTSCTCFNGFRVCYGP